MEDNSGDWPAEGAEDLQLVADQINPLAQLAADIAVAYEAIEQHTGSFCADCTCIGYHVPCDDGECELCGCTEIHWFCQSCGRSRAIEKFESGSKVCTYCVATPPITIRPVAKTKRVFTDSSGLQFGRTNLEAMDRAKRAREALKELTE